jgi:hypothetical protein
MAPVKHRILRRPEYLKINLGIQVSFVSQTNLLPSQETEQVLWEIALLLDMVENAITVSRPTLIFTLLTMNQERGQEQLHLKVTIPCTATFENTKGTYEIQGSVFIENLKVAKPVKKILVFLRSSADSKELAIVPSPESD